MTGSLELVVPKYAPIPVVRTPSPLVNTVTKMLLNTIDASLDNKITIEYELDNFSLVSYTFNAEPTTHEEEDDN